MSGSMWDATDALAPEVDWSAGTIPGTTSNADPNAIGVAGSAGLAVGTGTGQHGTVLLDGGGMVGSSVQHVWDWLNKPFNEPLSPYDIAIIVGVILISVIAWNLVLFHIRIAAETI
jgi:hypothetical protein